MGATAGVALTAREWAKQLDVKYAPTIVLFGRDGQEVIRSEAWFKTFHTQSIFDYVYSGCVHHQSAWRR